MDLVQTPVSKMYACGEILYVWRPGRAVGGLRWLGAEGPGPSLRRGALPRLGAFFCPYLTSARYSLHTTWASFRPIPAGQAPPSHHLGEFSALACWPGTPLGFFHTIRCFLHWPRGLVVGHVPKHVLETTRHHEIIR